MGPVERDAGAAVERPCTHTRAHAHAHRHTHTHTRTHLHTHTHACTRRPQPLPGFRKALLECGLETWPCLIVVGGAVGPFLKGRGVQGASPPPSAAELLKGALGGGMRRARARRRCPTAVGRQTVLSAHEGRSRRPTRRWHAIAPGAAVRRHVIVTWLAFRGTGSAHDAPAHDQAIPLCGARGSTTHAHRHGASDHCWREDLSAGRTPVSPPLRERHFRRHTRSGHTTWCLYAVLNTAAPRPQ